MSPEVESVGRPAGEPTARDVEILRNRGASRYAVERAQKYVDRRCRRFLRWFW